MQFESYNNDVKVNINALEKYFNKNTIKTEMNYDYDKPIPIKYITYYFNIPISFEILLDENKISLDKPLNAIVIRKEKLHKYNKYRTFIYLKISMVYGMMLIFIQICLRIKYFLYLILMT